MRPVALIGFMASGKSTIGEKLAERLELSFIDTDEQVTRTEGATPGQIIRELGESFFRQCEYKALSAVVDGPYAAVCATGGGIVTYEPSRRLLSEHFHVILLRIRAQTALRRILQDEIDRPLSKADHPLLHIEDLLRYRNPMYEQTAHFTVDADDSTPSDIVLQIENHVRDLV